MAAALVGGAVLSSIFNVVFDRMSSPEFANWIKGKKLTQNLLERLKTNLYAVQAFLNDAEQKQIKERAVKAWLDSLKDAMYVADDLLDEVFTKAATKKHPGTFFSRYLKLQDRKIANRIEEIIERIESIVKQKDTLGLREIPKENMSWRITTSLVGSSNIYGREADKEAIVKLLLDDDDTGDGDISVIPIVGMGGIGKTTLAQLIYNDDKMKGNFDFRGWVCVSEEFDVTKTIIEAITKSPCNLNDLNLLQHELKEKLSTLKFFVVFDDAWNEDYEDWNRLLKTFQNGVKGSKILITTRSKKVASVVQTVSPHDLSLLSDEDCWLVFSKHARLSTDSMENPTLRKVGKDIVKKCDGLPLAAQALGGLLRGNSDVEYWNHILKSEIWKFSNDKIKVIPALRISYYYLPSCLKDCFVYCSLYPKDYEFDKDELILLWMAQNFLQPVGRNTLEEVGDEYFDELVARSFLQPHSTEKNKFVMHDLVHDLAMMFAGEFYFRAEELQNACEVDIKTRHLSHNANGNFPISKLLGVCDRIKHTRTFLEINLYSLIPFNMENAPCIMLSQLKYLRALSFNNFPLESVPDSIGELIHLRYLDLSETDIVTLPESLGNLYNLQTLKLYCCRNLEMLPVGMKKLVNLRHLDIRETDLHEMPKGMSKLKNLQFLSDYVVGKRRENKITELGALANLHQSISISKLENVVNSSEASMARMFDKDGIRYLKLSWSLDEDENIVDSQIERDILDELQPHCNLKQLEIERYRGTRFPDWVGHSSYHNITTITLFGCLSCCMLPSLGQLPSLKHLTIIGFVSVEIVGAELYFNQNGESCLETPPFPMLETLSFYSMPSWKEWRSLGYNAFPRLRELSIRKCPVLRGDLPNNLPSLQSLKIEECDELSCCVPRAPAITSLSISGKHLVGSVVEAITNTQLTCLTSLSISGCSSHIWFPVSAIPPSLQDLTILDCRELEFQMDGQHKSLQKLLICESCDSVASFSLLDSFPNLVTVEIEKCEKMESIVVTSSLSSLRFLTINNCGSMKFVSTIWMAAPQLERLSLLRCPEIDLSAPGLPHRCLRSLFISYCEKLVSSAFMNSQFHGLTDLSIHGGYDESVSVKSFPKEGWLPASLESLKLFFIFSVETLECKGLAHLTSLHELSIYHCPKLENMEGEKLPASLKQLSISGSPLLGKRCEMKDPQLWPKISHIPAIQVADRWIS
ncbi:putative disease resistance protein At3g14460 isoform X1 [Arachis ipaensis]|uniref:putative disease resistance protein At3g14460 isoform X1 n=2 Tax=Arachis ipaensis TaxID=130454 RepID=UPI0007AF6592|nr:putative disease resistance protein At3g14460 isoform X1 [Arachis ipaensis]XP_020972271.1 putative disease resistance protein At3g14460 isoform X1 [Arachis ipaensis]XP_020972272.1 putative disease resistance protein At3g14460 isoform X1 [Arachis ipaensis]XP_020972273.1 putative disease resistance protein At3g14460 isoform X1 [Arachis ipaensis]XP_025634742.1 putative disease resistance protein At3g14460 isoform X1 [Arachis hypogaea]XP_029146786.1 putative disease resistance protein At3g14460